MSKWHWVSTGVATEEYKLVDEYGERKAWIFEAWPGQWSGRFYVDDYDWSFALYLENISSPEQAKAKVIDWIVYECERAEGSFKSIREHLPDTKEV